LTFGITPSVPPSDDFSVGVGHFPVLSGVFNEFIQWRAQGVNLGDRKVWVVDIVGDPAVVQATRGVGENSHVITIRAVAPVVAGQEIGWLDLVTDTEGVALHANEGIGQYKFGFEPIIINESMYAGVVGYTSGVTVWSSVWTPLGADPAPTLTDLGGGIVEVHWPDLGGFPNHTSEGLLVVNCTVDGVPVTATIEVTSSNTFYTNLAWGPSP
jgi:hypothetical protein